jgi:hypothetical protein
MHSSFSSEESNDEEVEPGTSGSSSTVQPNRKRRTMATRHRWSEAEKSAVKRQLSKFIKLRKVPGKVDCLNAINNEPALKPHYDNWQKIKFCVRNMYTSYGDRIKKATI